jgi:hypothetical protein
MRVKTKALESFEMSVTIQGGMRRIFFTAGDDFLGLCEGLCGQNVSYKHVSELRKDVKEY